MDDVLRASFHNVSSRIRSVVYNVADHITAEVLRKDVIGKTLAKHIAK